MRNSSGMVVPSPRLSADNMGDLGYGAGFKPCADWSLAILSGDVGGLHRILNPRDRMARAEQLILPAAMPIAFPYGMSSQNNGVYDAAITPDGNRAAVITGGRLYRLDSLRAAKAANVVWTHITAFPYDATLLSNDQDNVTGDFRLNRRKVAFDPVNNNVLVVATKTRLRVSTDSGVTIPQVMTVPAPTVGVAQTVRQMVDFDPLSPVISGRTARWAVAVAGSGVYVTQTGSEADLTLVFSSVTTFNDMFWDTETAGKLWILASGTGKNVWSWTPAGGLVNETKYPNDIRRLVIRPGTGGAMQMAFTQDGKPYVTRNNWVSSFWYQGTGNVRGIASRSPIAAGRLTGLMPGTPIQTTPDGLEVHFATGLGHCFTRWDDIPTIAPTTPGLRTNQFPVIEAGYQGINRLIGMNAKWLRDGRVAYFSHDVQMCISDPEAPFAAISNPSTELGLGYDIDNAIDDPDWYAFSAAPATAPRSGCFDLPGLPAMTTWTNTPVFLGGGIAVRNKGEVTLVGGQNNWPVQSTNADQPTPTWEDCTFTGFAKPAAGTELGFGWSSMNVRLIITVNKLTGERWCWNYLNPRWGIWRSPDGSAPFAKVLDGVIPSSVLYGTYAAQLLFAPGTHDLYLCARGGGLPYQEPANRIRVSRNAAAFAGTLAPFTDLPTLCNPAAMCFGAAMPGTSYPMLWTMAHRISDQALGIFGSPDGGLTWPIFWPWEWPTVCNSIAADPVKFGRLIVCVHGFGHQLLDLSARDNRRR